MRPLPFLAALLLAAPAGRAVADGKPTYNRDVRPILVENCFACHGPDKAARKADLRLDVREAALAAKAIVPGKPGESPIVERVFSDDKTALMPPPKSHKKLTEAQKQTLKAWVAAGAEYEEHWAFIPPKVPAPPAVKGEAWVRNPIDRFVLAALEKKGLTPAAEADRRTLARRVSLDATGLPPSPADVQAFVDDPAPDAYERFVEKMLSSPAWGEHRGRYWLDAARYADSNGIHFDNYREMWSYREWVMRSFNRNQPFDRFTIDQLAGDLLPRLTVDQHVASGFNRCNMTTSEGGAINEEYLVLYTRDRTETVAQVWLGLTMGCAVCHTHKLDPITQREFYQLAAFFNNTTQAAMDGNIHNTPPTILVPRAEDAPRWAELEKKLAEAKKDVDARKAQARGAFDKWLTRARGDSIREGVPTDKLALHMPLSEGKGNKVNGTAGGKPVALDLPGKQLWNPGHVADKAFRTRADGTVSLASAGDYEKDQAFSFGAWVKLKNDRFTGAIFSRMAEANDFRGWDLWVEGGRIGSHVVSKWQSDAIKVVAGNPVGNNVWSHVFVTYDGTGKAAGLKVYVNGVEQTARNVTADSLKGSIRTTVPWKLAGRNDSSRLDDVNVQDVRLYDKALTADEVARVARGTRAAHLVTVVSRTPPQNDELFAWYLAGNDEAFQQAQKGLTKLQGEEQLIRSRGTVAHVMSERPTKPMAHVLFRGDYDKRREQVSPDVPAVLPKMKPSHERDRLGLAKWLVEPGHPLTARVTVNRFWQEVFGTGLVRTAGDFGMAGDSPTHPELLDWLATSFSSDWDVKRLFRLMLTSAAYRQSAEVTPVKREKDRDNALLSRGPRFRMDAEMVRDHALAAGGLLVTRQGGPSVKPYQPEGIWEAVAISPSNTRFYKRDSGEALYRRSVYTFWKRAAPPASMEIFNAPPREVCVVKRERTNTPLQALVTLNDPQFVEAARTLATAALKAGETADARLDFATSRLMARTLRAEERKVMHEIVEDLTREYRDKPDEARKLLAVGESKADETLDPKALAAWTMVVNALMNLDEVLCK